MKRLLFTVILFALVHYAAAQKRDSTSYEYARVIYSMNKIKLFYEGGSYENLKEVLKLRSTLYSTLSDSVASIIFFKVNDYLRSKGFELVTSTGAVTQPVDIYKRKKIMKIDDKK